MASGTIERKPRNRPVNNFYVPPPARRSEIQSAYVSNDSKTKDRIKLKSPTEETKVCNNSSLLFCKNDESLQSNNHDPPSSKKKSSRKKKSAVNKNLDLENTNSALRRHESRSVVPKCKRTNNHEKSVSCSLNHRSPSDHTIFRSTVSDNIEKVDSIVNVDVKSSLLSSKPKMTDNDTKMCNNSSLLFQSDEDSDYYELEKVNLNVNLDMKNGLVTTKSKKGVNKMKMCNNSSLLFQSDNESDHYGSEKVTSNFNVDVKSFQVSSKSKNTVHKMKMCDNSSLLFESDDDEGHYDIEKLNFNFNIDVTNCPLSTKTKKTGHKMKICNNSRLLFKIDDGSNLNSHSSLESHSTKKHNPISKPFKASANEEESTDSSYYEPEKMLLRKVPNKNEDICLSHDRANDNHNSISDNIDICIIDNYDIFSIHDRTHQDHNKFINDKHISGKHDVCINEEKINNNHDIYISDTKSIYNHIVCENDKKRYNNSLSVCEYDEERSNENHSGCESDEKSANHGNDSLFCCNLTTKHSQDSKTSKESADEEESTNYLKKEPYKNEDICLSQDRTNENHRTSISDNNSSDSIDICNIGKTICDSYDIYSHHDITNQNHNNIINDKQISSKSDKNSSDNHSIEIGSVETENVSTDNENEIKCNHNSDLDHMNRASQSLHECTLKENLENPSDNLSLCEKRYIVPNQSRGSCNGTEDKEVLKDELNSIASSPKRRSRKNSSSFSSSDDEYGSAYEELLLSNEENPSRAETPCVLNNSNFGNNSDFKVSESKNEKRIKTPFSNSNEVPLSVSTNVACETDSKTQSPVLKTEKPKTITILKRDPALRNKAKKNHEDALKYKVAKLNFSDSNDSPSLEDEDFDWEKLTDDDFNNLIASKYSVKESAHSGIPGYTEQDSNDSSIIEIYGFPVEFKTQDIFMSFNAFMNRGFKLKWVDDTHALGIFPSPALADEALRTQMPFLKTRPLSQATPASLEKAKYVTFPSASRPKTCSALARRLVSGALGVRAVFTREEREAEREILKEAREKKRLAARQRDAAWEGKF